MSRQLREFHACAIIDVMTQTVCRGASGVRLSDCSVPNAGLLRSDLRGGGAFLANA